MNSQDCLTYLLEAIALTFAALMLIDFATGLPLLTAAPKATPNPLDMSAVFEVVDDSLEEICSPMVNKEICQPLVVKTTAAAIVDPWTLPVTTAQNLDENSCNLYSATLLQPHKLFLLPPAQDKVADCFEVPSRAFLADVATTPDLSSMTRDASAFRRLAVSARSA